MLSPDHLAAGVAWVHFAFAAFVVLGFGLIIAGAVYVSKRRPVALDTGADVTVGA